VPSLPTPSNSSSVQLEKIRFFLSVLVLSFFLFSLLCNIISIIAIKSIKIEIYYLLYCLFLIIVKQRPWEPVVGLWPAISLLLPLLLYLYFSQFSPSRLVLILISSIAAPVHLCARHTQHYDSI
jgi:hypothetical protein